MNAFHSSCPVVVLFCLALNTCYPGGGVSSRPLYYANLITIQVADGQRGRVNLEASTRDATNTSALKYHAIDICK